MKHTFFDTPVLRTVLHWIAKLVLKLSGWKADGVLPKNEKFVLIAAPHTSNWDLPMMLLFAFHFKLKIYWMGKESIFKKPFKTIFQWMGGIPINRSKSNNVVEQSIQQFEKHESLVLTVPPTGTRSRVRKWKSGFYHIANGANVPISLGFLDYKRKIGGLGPLFYPTGDIEADIKEISKFYINITGKYPETSKNSLPIFNSIQAIKETH
ncbi:lysophospholipid acyltransferase family protein [bacterium]|nr:lysophospholipid acyltransferase family protein [bacterium]